MSGPRPTLRCPCGDSCSAQAETVFRYEAPPEGETRFDLGNAPYRREYRRCGLCGHFFSMHDIDLSGLYGGAYVSGTYGDRMRRTFERILALPPERSDNAGRVRRVLDFAARRFGGPGAPAPLTLLDIGAGLGVFPHRMKEAGWLCTALDPDPSAAGHLRDVAGVIAVTADFMTADATGLGRFHAVTLNKVLEHVEDPVAMLERASRHLLPNGFVYIEVPDGEAASREGLGREEFFIEHHHVFSPTSLALTAARAGLDLLELERLREPSTKYTLRAFLALPEATRLEPLPC